MSQRYFENIKSAEKRRLRYFLLAYLFAGIICVAIALFFSTANGVIAGLMMGYYIGWKLTELIREKIKLPCPLCDAEELEESFTLQCKPSEYKCSECDSVYKEGVLIEK